MSRKSLWNERKIHKWHIQSSLKPNAVFFGPPKKTFHPFTLHSWFLGYIHCRWTKFLVICELAPVPSLVWGKLLFLFSWQVKNLLQLTLRWGRVGWWRSEVAWGGLLRCSSCFVSWSECWLQGCIQFVKISKPYTDNPCAFLCICYNPIKGWKKADLGQK